MIRYFPGVTYDRVSPDRIKRFVLCYLHIIDSHKYILRHSEIVRAGFFCLLFKALGKVGGKRSDTSVQKLRHFRLSQHVSVASLVIFKIIHK